MWHTHLFCGLARAPEWHTEPYLAGPTNHIVFDHVCLCATALSQVLTWRP